MPKTLKSGKSSTNSKATSQHDLRGADWNDKLQSMQSNQSAIHGRFKTS